MFNLKQVFTSVTDLENGLYPKLREAQNNTMKVLLDKLTEFIDKYVYSNPNKGWYDRTGDLRNIWQVNKTYIKGGTIRSSIEPSNHSALTRNNELWQHESQVDGFGNLTTYDLVNIINNGLESSHSVFGEISPRPFWDFFQFWATNNYQRIFREECVKLGLPLSSIGGGGGLKGVARFSGQNIGNASGAYKSNVGSIINKK